jgi:hypothetical protein
MRIDEKRKAECYWLSLSANSEGQTWHGSIFVRVPHSMGRATSRKLSRRVLGVYY